MRPRAMLTLLAVVGAGILSAKSVAAEAKREGVPARTRFEQDTVYYVALNLDDTTATMYYGVIPLVSCRFHPADRDQSADFGSDWDKHTGAGWQTVSDRIVWAGYQAVSDTIVGVVAKVSSVNPELIKRVLPERFEIDLTRNYRLRVMTSTGAVEKRGFDEIWRSWKGRWNPFDHHETLDLMVSPQDAQTLYYALEPGTPVVLIRKVKAK